MQPNNFIVLEAGDTSFILSCEIGGRPQIVYWGPRLERTDPQLLVKLATRQHAHGSADEEASGTLLNEIGVGTLAPPGFSAHRSGENWAASFHVESITQPSPQSVEIACADRVADIKATHTISLDAQSEILTCGTIIENVGDRPVALEWCAACVFPIDARLTEITGFSGRWANEFQTEKVPIFLGSYVRENRRGRTSHDCFPGLIIEEVCTSEQSGACVGFHLGWSGNSRIRVDQLSDGRQFAQLGELLLPGEQMLASGERYQTPALYAGYSHVGRTALSQKFQNHVRHQVLNDRLGGKVRPVHFNTWEAVYFDHDEEKLTELAEVAADVGVERFILDDGWFGGRRSDAAGLGDWQVSKSVYPNGLSNIIKRVNDLGMEFGIWMEPEMVNPDSDLFRAHPGWILGIEGLPQISSRGQYVLDLTRADVFDHIFSAIDAILSDHNIGYVKWDMNRDIHHPESRAKPAAHAQSLAVYRLMDKVRAAHPDIEIEACASGGGRADYGVLEYADRIWTSDSNDALDRQIIQRGASHFFPLEILGAHVGPQKCHITGRRLSMELRVATAFFGHMGLELNLLTEALNEIEILKAGIALHKAHRSLIHSGEYVRLDTPSDVNAFGVVSEDMDEALFSYCLMTGHRETLPGRIRFAGLNSEKDYRIKIIWPEPVPVRTAPSIVNELDLGGEGAIVSGEALMQFGIQAPLVYPETCIIYHVLEQ